MPFQTKTFEFKTPRATIPKDSIRTLTIPDGTNAPQVKTLAQYISEFKPSTNTKTADARRLIIDTQGDQRYVQLFVNYFAVSIFENLDHKQHADISPASISSYCMALFHFFHLGCDKFYRKPNSPACVHYFEDDSRRTIFEDALNCLVPPFLADFLKYHMPSSDPRRPDIQFLPTYACFSPQHDFPRFVPAQFMLSAHNMFASVRANQRPGNIFHHWTKSPLIIEADRTAYIAASTLIGVNFAESTTPANWPTSFTDNWFYNQIHALLNPIVVRTLSARYVFDAVDVEPYNMGNVNNLLYLPSGAIAPADDFTYVNPYIYATSTGIESAANQHRFLLSMSQHLEDSYAGLSSLGSILQFDSGDSILKHAYQGPALPTWSPRHDLDEFDMDAEETTTLRKKTFVQLATHLKFMQHERPFTPSTRHAYAVFPQSDAHDGTPAIGFTASALHGAINRASDDNNLRPSMFPKYRQFDENIDVLPNLRILLPFDANPSEGHEPQLTGRIIETAEIDGFSIPHPDTRLTLSVENSSALSSAVAVRYIKRASTTETYLRDRILRDQQSTPVTVNLYDSSVHEYRRYTTDFHADTTYTSTHSPFGFTAIGDQFAKWYDQITNKFSYKVATSSAKTTAPPIVNGYIWAWSPYRYRHDVLPDNVSEGIFMLLDMRTIFGTATPMMSSEHPSIRMPTI